MKPHLLWVDGRFEDSTTHLEVHSPFDGRLVATVAQADDSVVERALVAASDAFHKFKNSSSYTRSRLLSAMAQGIGQRREKFVELLIHEAGKPRMLADVEVSRAIATFTLASEEAKRQGGELLPIDLDASGRAYAMAQVSHVPRGPVLAIGPFNFPLNLIAHKVAPALAVGASVIVKPPPQAPGAAVLLAEVFAEAAAGASDSRELVPLTALQVVSGSNEAISKAVKDLRVAVLSFTGSDRVGWMLQGLAIKKKVCLELGGNAAVIVHEDASLERAAARSAFGAFAYAGQICISVQRIFAHEAIASRFEDLLLREVARIQTGDPAKGDTLVGPLIDATNVERVMGWIDEAKRGGARVLAGGERKGNVIAPTVIVGANPSDRINIDEVFGPVVTLQTYRGIDEAIARVNDSRFGLQAGIFTDSARVIGTATAGIEAGGILINEVPTVRADNMPYGGMKDSGLGREGVRYAMEDFCETKTVIHWKG